MKIFFRQQKKEKKNPELLAFPGSLPVCRIPQPGGPSHITQRPAGKKKKTSERGVFSGLAGRKHKN